MVHLQITHEKKGKWSKPNLLGIMFQPLIFRGVYHLFKIKIIVLWILWCSQDHLRILDTCHPEDPNSSRAAWYISQLLKVVEHRFTATGGLVTQIPRVSPRTDGLMDGWYPVPGTPISERLSKSSNFLSFSSWGKCEFQGKCCWFYSSRLQMILFTLVTFNSCQSWGRPNLPSSICFFRNSGLPRRRLWNIIFECHRFFWVHFFLFKLIKW